MDRQKKVGHVLIVGNVKASLHTAKAMLTEDVTDLRVGLRDAFGVVLLSVRYRRSKATAYISEPLGHPRYGLADTLRFRL